MLDKTRTSRRRPPRQRKGATAWLIALLAVTAAVGGAVLPTAQPAGATAPSIFVAVGGRADGAPECDTATTATSFDLGISWPTSASTFTPTPAPCLNGGELSDIATTENGTWLAVGSRKLANGWYQGVVFRSTNNGTTWAQVSTSGLFQGPEPKYRAITTDGTGRWVVAGSGWLLGYSNDNGTTWSYGGIYGVGNWPLEFQDVAEQPGPTQKWVAVGWEQMQGTPRRVPVVFESTNGTNWARMTTNVASSATMHIELNGVAMDAAGSIVSVGSTENPANPPGRLGQLTLMKPAGSNTYGLLSPYAALSDTTKGGLNAISHDPVGLLWMAVGERNLGFPDASAFRATMGSGFLNPWSDISAALPFATGRLQAVANDQYGNWVAVGGDGGAATVSHDNGTTWGPEIQLIPGPKGTGLMRGVAMRPNT